MATTWWPTILRARRRPRRRARSRAGTCRPLLEALEARSLPSVLLTPDTFAGNSLPAGTYALRLTGANEGAAAAGLDVTRTGAASAVAGPGQTVTATAAGVSVTL